MLKDEHTKQEAFILGFDLAIDLVIKNLRIKVVDDQTENVVEYLEPEGFLDLMDETYSIDIENILKLKE